MDSIVILDTNVLLHDPASINNFPKHHVIIPIGVIEQADRFKRDLGELGKNARDINRMLDSYRHKGSLTDGIDLENGSRLQIILKHSPLEESSQRSSQYKGPGIVAIAMDLKEKHPDKKIKIVTKDLNLRVKADALGIKAEGYEKDRFDDALTYSGHHHVEVSEEEYEEFNKLGSLALSNPKHKLRPNEFCTLKSSSGKTLGLARVAAHAPNILVPLEFNNEEVVGLRPLNTEQTFVVEALLNDNIKLVTLHGNAGTGKTLLAVAAGLKKVLRDFTYNKVLVARPTIPMGRDIGFLPGDIDEKMKPWMQPIYDSIEFIRTLDRRSRKPTLPANLMEIEELSVEPLTYIRGRSIPHQFLIIDEAQNLTPLEAKTIITRVGTNSKIILTGDPMQIDSPYMDAYSNGMSYVVGKFRDSKLAAHIKLKKGERSELAEEAVQVL
ncbi:MAG: PhoH family protein [Lentisphaeraceae bacterium]|nr:PhoH family protein [Lentisphaeraceae bacterium]